MKLHGKPCKMCTRYTVTRSGTGLHLLSAFLARNGGRSGNKKERAQFCARLFISRSIPAPGLAAL